MSSSLTSRTFEGIEFVDSRITHNETTYDAIPRMMAEAYGTTAGDRLPLDPHLGELVRLLVAQNSRCSYCSILHTQESRALGILSAKIDVLPAWREAAIFTSAEVAAFAYTEALSGLRQGDIAAAHEGLREHFDNAAIEALTMVIINMDMWTRLFLARGRTPHPAP